VTCLEPLKPELAHDPKARQRGVGDQRQAFAREAADTPAAFMSGIVNGVGDRA
jgi:hypothetical protein